MEAVAWLKRQKHLTDPWLRRTIGLGWLSGILLAVQAWLLADTINAVSFHHQTLASQWPRLSALLVLFLLRALLGWASEYSATHAAVKLKHQLRGELFDKLRLLGPAWISNHSGGELTTSLSDGIEALGGYYSRYLPATIFMAAIPFSLLVFIAPRDWGSALILLVTAPLIPLFMILIGQGAEKRNQRQWRQLTRMNAYFLDVIQGLGTLKLFNASRREAKVIGRISDEYRSRTLSVLRIAFLSSFTLEFFATVSIAVVAVIIGFRLYWGQMDFTQGFFVLLLAPEYYLPLRNLGSTYHDRMEAIGAAERLINIFEAPTHPPGTRIFLPQQSSGISFSLDSVGFIYAGNRTGLENLTLTIAAGRRVAVVGPSGSGKSTFFNLLLGFLLPTTGEIHADGQALCDLDLQSWRSQIAWVPQSPHLFHGSVLDNIRLGKTGASREAVEQAAASAHCLDFIQDLPQGFETGIGEGGRTLSGGQRQRIALARAFLRKAPLVLLDEPTANLDLHSEQLIQQAVDDLAQDATVITIAHRLHSVRQADTILVFQEGRLIEQGNHQTLQTSGGLYSQLLGAYGESR